MKKTCSCGCDIFYQIASYNILIKSENNCIEKIIEDESKIYHSGYFCNDCGDYHKSIIIPEEDIKSCRNIYPVENKETKKWI